MFEAIMTFAVVVLAVWLIWKLGLFVPVVNLGQTAAISSDDFASKVAHKSALNAAKYAIDPEVFKQAMESKARNRAYRQSMVDQVTTVSKGE